ncbi:NAD(P)-binding domain protein [Niveomyces insectorum RCEF 264]|uniref:NAD(P)-binding domain protein n=1 Tax=Niveomyces insectorum RCEF 264 TaxID=1081102 RepID=A0A167ME46_9HYPO|nr:NAD(P)-binding domain protein [Niveomyces insectorum RCEF 264]
MTTVHIPADLPLFAEAKGKVVVLTGGSTGIGEATVRLFHRLGAFVHFLDIDTKNGERLANELGSNVTFYPGSVIEWADQLHVFESAVAAHGHVDIVLANAGIDEVAEDAFVDTFDAATGKLQPPTLVVLDVNLRGVLYSAKLALSFFRRYPAPDGPGGGSFVATASAASYLDTPGIPVYNAAKHGVLGFMRSLRNTLPPAAHIRVNVVAPAFVQTKFTQHLLAAWQHAGLPVNQPDQVAPALAYLALNGACQGQALFVAGGTYTELEGPIDAARAAWMGPANAAWVNRKKALNIKFGKADE